MSTVRRLQRAIAKGDYDGANQIINALSEEDAKFLVFALALSQFEGTTTL